MISFARALAHNPRYLILDEATSSVDTETEFRVRDALAQRGIYWKLYQLQYKDQELRAV